MKLKGKTILISGAAKRIGEALAKACAERGANLLLHSYRSTEEVKKIAKTLKRKKIDIHTFQADLSLVEEVEKLIQALLSQKLIPDIIIHNASLFYPQKLSETKLTDIDQFFNLHFKAPFLINQAFGPLMKQKGEGHILHFIDAGILNHHPSYMA